MLDKIVAGALYAFINVNEVDHESQMYDHNTAVRSIVAAGI